MPRLEGKIAVITGGSSGIGLASAKRFVKEGAYVFITGRRQAELDKASAEIGSNVTAVKGDVANPNDLDRLYQTVVAKKGKLDILVCECRSCGASTYCRRYDRALRQDLRYKCSGRLLYRTKGPSSDEGRRFDHRQRLRRLAEGNSDLFDV